MLQIILLLLFSFTIGLLSACQLSTERKNISISKIEITKESADESPATGFNYFPYNIQLDTIAYSSCNPTAGNFFTFKVGAYFSRSGLRLSEYFLQQLTDKETKRTNQEVIGQINTSTKLIAKPRLTITKETDFLSIVSDTSSLFNLSSLSTLIATLVENKNTRIQTVNQEPIEAITLISNIAFTIATELNDNTYRLVFSYLNQEDQTIHKAATDFTPGVDIYGSSYQLSFSETYQQRYYLNRIVEKQHPNNPPQTNWTCPESMKFTINRNKKYTFVAQKMYDAQSQDFKNQQTLLEAQGYLPNEPNYIPEDEPICPNSTEGGATLDIVKKVLGDKWNINIPQKCISYKSTSFSCYHTLQSATQLTRVEFENTDECDNNNGFKKCPHTVSICLRNN